MESESDRDEDREVNEEEFPPGERRICAEHTAFLSKYLIWGVGENHSSAGQAIMSCHDEGQQQKDFLYTQQCGCVCGDVVHFVVHMHC